MTDMNCLNCPNRARFIDGGLCYTCKAAQRRAIQADRRRAAAIQQHNDECELVAGIATAGLMTAGLAIARRLLNR